MKKFIAIAAAVLTFGFIGAGVASAHFGPHYYNTPRIAHVMPGPGYMHRTGYMMHRGYGPGFGFCFNSGGHRWDAGRHHMRGYGYGPMHGGRW